MIKMELSDSLQRDLAEMLGHESKEDVAARSVKFDDYGTLHVIEYDKEDKHVGDIVVRNQNNKSVYKNSLNESLVEAKEKTKESEKVNKALIIISALLAVSMICCVVLIAMI